MLQCVFNFKLFLRLLSSLTPNGCLEGIEVICLGRGRERERKRDREEETEREREK